jgi:repressor LexA
MAKHNQKLGERQTRIMQFLTDFQESHGYSPSIREIGEYIDVKSTSLVDYYLRQLEKLNYIRRDGRISRSICVLQPMYGSVGGKVIHAVRETSSALRDLVNVPLLGRIVASAPIPMPTQSGGAPGYFDPESSVEVARSMLPVRERLDQLFALEVQGDSMIDAMINDGDIVILRPAQEANNGDMVAVWLDDRDETTLKYFYREPDRIRLQPANRTMQPIMVDDPAHLRIMGKVVMVIRQVQSVAA